ncbi:MAG: ABC transporter ATP-binding protein [Acidimicrobiia bacterium]
MAQVALDEVSKIYPGGTVAVDDLSLDIRDGEFMVLVGPSGCGKTTALRMVAGLESITAGEVRIGDRPVNRVPSKDRDIAMVFQNYALYPHLTVGENLGFSLKLHKVPKAELRRRVDEVARILGIEEFLDRKPRALSGGQRQRVAMGRAIVREPEAFLMDEPLSNLDAKLRVQMRAEIARIQRDLGTTTIYVTHDQTEAMTMGDRVAVLKRGVLQQADEPQLLYEQPKNVFVGGFIGSPAMNLIEATIEDQGGPLFALAGSQRLALRDEVVAARPGLRDYVDRPLVLGIRPESLEDAAFDPEAPSDQRLEATVELVEQMGAEAFVHMTVEARAVLTEDTRELARDRTGVSDESLAERAESARTECVARVNPRSRAKKGDRIELVVDTSRLYFFDLTTGLAIEGAPAPNGAGTTTEVAP